MAELQVIPARHGTATFVPAGQTIKIVNTSGTQVIDTWAFALPKPEPKKGAQDEKAGQNGEDEKKDAPEEKKEEPKQDTPKPTPAKAKKSGMNLPSQEEAEKATQEGLKEGEETGKAATKDGKPQKNTWGSYVPSIGWSSKKKDPKAEAEQKKNSRTWGSYFPSGKGFSNYVPKTASDTVSAFASTVSNVNRSHAMLLQLIVLRARSTRTRATLSNSKSSQKHPSEQQVGAVTIPSLQNF